MYSQGRDSHQGLSFQDDNHESVDMQNQIESDDEGVTEERQAEDPGN